MPGDAFVQALLAAAAEDPPTDKTALHRLKQATARRLKAPLPTDAQLAAAIHPPPPWAHLLVTKPMRSQSGVAVVAVMSSPAGCPHGKCVYCPGGPEVGVPQSYTGHEPSTMRAIQWEYDPYRIVRSRLAQLRRNGHPVDKVDIVIQGGTFPARDPVYQDWFVTGIYRGLNDGPGAQPPAHEAPTTWQDATPEWREERLREAQLANEEAACRAIGLTIETKPDWCLQEHVDGMLRLGATRVELGLQVLDDATLRFTHRGHTLQDSRAAMRIARDAGLKVCVHMMPGNPRPRGDGSIQPDPGADLEDMRRLFAHDAWRPDMLKVYPTLVVQEGDTPLKKWWREGRYTPYGTAEARDLIAHGMQHVPEYCRIQRIDRDIPTTHVEAGVDQSNLRQLVEQQTPADQLVELRHREAGARTRQGHVPDPARAILVRCEYPASQGREVFLSLEDPHADAVLGFLRLRRTSDQAHRDEARGAAIVRELKVFGSQVPIGQEAPTGSMQHRGMGARLLAEAERIAAGWGCRQLLVTAGVGVKAYYRRHGYDHLGPYMAKSPT